MDKIKDIIDWIGYILTGIGLIAAFAKSIEIWSRLKTFTWNDIDKCSKSIIKMIEKDNYFPDIIVGIGRGGSIIGSILSGNLPVKDPTKYRNTLFLGIDRMYDWKSGKRIEINNEVIDFSPLRGKKILLVACDVVTGNTMDFYKVRLESVGASEVKTCCLIRSVQAITKIDYIGRNITTVFSMPWMYKGFNYSRDSRVPK